LAAEIDDASPATKSWNERKKGESMAFESAFFIIGDKKYTLDLNESDKTADFSIYAEVGKTTIESGFFLKNGQKTTAFYTDIIYNDNM